MYLFLRGCACSRYLNSSEEALSQGEGYQNLSLDAGQPQDIMLLLEPLC